MSSKAHLKKSQERKQKESDIAQSSSEASTSDKCDDIPEESMPLKCLCSSAGGPLHEKAKCVWCMKGEDKKHANRSRGKLFRSSAMSAWRTFRRHPVLVEET